MLNPFKAFKALSYPVLPLVPDCTYCAAMRFGLLGSIIGGAVTGCAVRDIWAGLLFGLLVGAVLVLLLWLEFKFVQGE